MDVVRPAETDAEGNVFNNTEGTPDEANDMAFLSELNKKLGKVY